MNNQLPPFSCTYTPNVPALLTELHCSLAITTYQAGKLIFLSPDGPNTMRQLPRDFEKAMGLAIEQGRMALATRTEVTILANAPELAAGYPAKPGFYDAFFVPRVTYYTGEVDIHDLGWAADGRLWAVNTLFSCLVTLDDHYSFRPQWKPPFIETLESGDHCHLNGMAMREGKPAFVSMFGQTNTFKGWRIGVESSGLLMEVESGEVVAADLPMPHSPRWYNGQLFCLLSATGELVRVDLGSGKYDVVCRLKGFVRGMARRGDYLFVGLSSLRKNASTFRSLPITREPIFCGIEIVHLPSGNLAGHIRYQQSVEEIYDVQVMPGALRPGILNHTASVHRLALHTPQGGFWAEPAPAGTSRPGS